MAMESSPYMNQGMKRILLLVHCVMLATGISAGPLIMRLYYLYGGKSIWLTSWLETGGWPIMILPLLVAYIRRRAADPTQANTVFINLSTTVYAAVVGLVAGAGDYCYAYGIKHIPVSTSSLILVTQLAFTAVFAFMLVRQKFTSYSTNAVALLTFGAIVLSLHSSNDRPEGESSGQYYLGFFFTLASSALFALMLPMIELTYRKYGMTVTYSLVMEIQLVLSFSATAMCTIGVFASGEIKEIGREVQDYKLGSSMYFIVIIFSALAWQFFYLGAAGVIHYGSSLLSGIIIAVSLPISELAAVYFYHEKFTAEKGVCLVLSLWGFLSYFYGESVQMQQQKKEKTIMSDDQNNIESFA